MNLKRFQGIWLFKKKNDKLEIEKFKVLMISPIFMKLWGVILMH